MIELGNRQVVVISATPFGFGPVSTSLSLVRELLAHDVAIVWLAAGTALELLAKEEEVGYVVEFDINDPGDRERWTHLIEEADLVVSNTDPEFAEYAVARNSNVAYVDILYWMWDALPPVVHQTSYVYEWFVANERQRARLGLPERAIEVGPLVEPTSTRAPAERRGPHLVVSLGGLHRSIGENPPVLERYVELILAALERALAGSNTELATVYVALGGGAQRTFVLPSGPTVEIGSLSKRRYRELLDTADAALITPGLTGFYECVASGTPTFFLPPHNYSQVLQLQVFLEEVPGTDGVTWSDLGVLRDVEWYQDETTALRTVDALVGEGVTRVDRLADRLRQFLDRPDRRGSVLGAALRPSGAAAAAQHLLELLPRAPGPAFGPVAAPLPATLNLELFAGCQLRCPLCPTGERRSGRSGGRLRMETLDQIEKLFRPHRLREVKLYNWGEPFLHPDALAIIARVRTFADSVEISTNLQRMPDPAELVRSGLTKLIVSCHGYRQEVYERYMVRGDVARTLANLDALASHLTPGGPLEVEVRFVEFAHNLEDVGLMQAHFAGTAIKVNPSPMRMHMADEIELTPAESIVRYADWIPDSSRFYDKSTATTQRAPIGCNLASEEITIDVHGNITFCCSVFLDDDHVGNVHDIDTLETIWNGVEYQSARRIGRRQDAGEPAVDLVCTRCRDSGFRDF